MSEKLRVSGINKYYYKNGERFKVLDSISFTAGSGEVLCLLGPSGCGKSTLLRLICGLDEPEDGLVRLDGKAVSCPSPAAVMIFQEFGQLFPWRTVLDNVIYPMRVNGIGRSEAERKQTAETWLVRVGLEGFFHVFPHTLSGGMKQKAALARALALEPSLLLMDEPFGSLDALTREGLQRLLLQIREETGSTILFVTHDIQEALTLGDRILVMGKEPGRILKVLENSVKKTGKRSNQEKSALYDVIHNLLGTV